MPVTRLGDASPGAHVQMSPMRVGYDTLRAKVLYSRIEDELRAIPGVTGVTMRMSATPCRSSQGMTACECGVPRLMKRATRVHPPER